MDNRRRARRRRMSTYAHRRGVVSGGYVPWVKHLEALGDTSDASTYTFSSASLGRPHATRKIIAAVATRGSPSSHNVNSVTVAGISATSVLTLSFNGNNNKLTFWVASVPTGTSGNIVVTLS